MKCIFILLVHAEPDQAAEDFSPLNVLPEAVRVAFGRATFVMSS